MKWSRRELIKSAGAWALLAPVLRARGAGAEGLGAPRRVIVLFSPNGPCVEKGPALGEERDFILHEWWSPLERHKADGLFFTGLHQAGVPFGEHNEWGHQSAGTGALTARTTEKTNNSTGPSIDQFIGQELERMGESTPRRSVLWGLHERTGHWGPWYEAAGKPVSPIYDPYDALAELAPFLGGGNEIEARRAALGRRRLILDTAWRDCAPLRRQLGAQGKEILDFHCANLESLEQSVDEALAAGGECPVSDGPATTLAPGTNFKQRATRDEAMGAFVEMAAMSFACDLTRVIGLSFGATAARFAIPESYGIPSSAKVDSGDSGPQHHAWTHVYGKDDASVSARRKALRGFNQWYAEWVARLIDKLKSTPDASGGSLFDSTLVLWTSELGYKSDHGAHPNTNIPVMLFGNSMGAFETGRFYNTGAMIQGDWSRQKAAMPLHNLFVSIIRHAGLSHVDTFGNAGVGPLDWLTG
ncbi:MAG: DUF1552 domain-containing protein [Myxococcota bacterium]